MKSFYTLTFYLFITSQIYSQSPDIVWQKNYGGDEWDEPRSIIATEDGGFLVGGLTKSGISGNKTLENFGSFDAWLLKLDANGDVQWEKEFGGEDADQIYSLAGHPDGGYLLGCWSNSGTTGNKTAMNYGERDIWLIKIDTAGNINWQTTIGGDLNDYLFIMKPTMDGGYILGGFSESGISGLKTEENIGIYDYWVIKIDKDANIEWQNTIGGYDDDRLHGIDQALDGGYIVGGTSGSDMEADKTENSMSEDYWVLKLSPDGEIEWQNSIIAEAEDELFDLIASSDGGFLITGFSTSGISADKTEACYGWQDGWIVKLTDDGEIEWQNNIGGYLGDRVELARQLDNGNYFFAAGTFSDLGGDVAEDSEDWEYWLFETDPTGNMLWQKSIGGFDVEIPRGVTIAHDNGYVVAGQSRSAAGLEKTLPNYGDYDFYIIKLNCSTPPTYYVDADGDSFGDAASPLTICSAPAGYVSDATDCNDSYAQVYPGAAEIADGLDNDCDALVDEGIVAITDINTSNTNISPNPNSGEFVISIYDIADNPVSIEVYDVLGSKIFSEIFQPAQSFNIQLEDIFSGVANVVISCNGNSMKSTIIVMQ